MGDAGDDADFTAAVVIAPAFGGFAGVIGAGGADRQLFVNAGDDFSRWQYFIHAPAVGTADVHVFDEAQDVRRVFEVARHGQNFVIVDAFFDDHIDFDRAQSGLMRSVDTFE